jgi:hypothetical protein
MTMLRALNPWLAQSQSLPRSPRLYHVLLLVLLVLLASWAVQAQEKDPSGSQEPPTFDTTSNDPVLLRYKLKVDQVEKLRVDMAMSMRIRQGAGEMNMKMTMRMDAKAVVTNIDGDGNMSCLVKITRMVMKVAGPKQVEFDSDNPNDDPNFKAVTATINVGIPCKLSPEGKLLETDLEPLRLAASRAGQAAFAKSLEDSTKQMFEGTYIQLSERPIKSGETYKAGTIVSGKTKSHSSYKIRSVSGDKTQVILEPVAVLELAPGAFPPGVEARIKSQRMEGWILFDLEKGHASKADVRVKMVIDINAKGQTGTMEMTAATTMTSTLE